MTGKIPKMRKQDFYEETVGNLVELTKTHGLLIAMISSIALILPLEMESKLRPLLGMRLGILRTDIPGKEYLTRIISEPVKETALMTYDSQELAQGVV
jgi:hypothetical protein